MDLHTEKKTLDRRYRKAFKTKSSLSELDDKTNPTQIHKRVKDFQVDKHLENATGDWSKIPIQFFWLSMNWLKS